jgi:ZIP family zinc transporter
MNNLFNAIILTTIASMSTGIGGILAVIPNKKNYNFLSFSLGLSAGVMIFISLFNISFESINYLCSSMSFNNAILILIIGFIFGTLLVVFTDKVLNNDSLYNTGIINMIAIILHNLPEGIVVFMTSSNNIVLGITMAITIAIHNIPEGIAISSPIYFSKGNRKKAVMMSLISGFAELFGAIITFIFLKSIINNITIGITLSIVIGIMISISVLNLIPESKKYDNKNYHILGFIFGSIISLIIVFLHNIH